MFKKRMSSIIVVVIYLLFSILLANIPLFNYLGYEFSFMIGALAYFISGIVTITILKKTYEGSDDIETDLKSLLKGSIRANLIFLLIPFIIISLNAFFIPNCSFLNGLLFFILLPVISIFFSVSLSSFIFILVKKRVLWFLIISFILIFFSVLTFYLYPQTFLYNPIFGYFSGMVYDEELSISYTLVLYRLSNLVEGLLLVYAFLTISRYVKKGDKIFKKLSYLKNILADYKYSTLLIIVLIVFWFFENELHILSSEYYIQSELGGYYSTKHFDIFYSSATYNEREIKRIGGLHEYYYGQIQKELKTNFDKKIKSYIYPSAEYKRDLTGAKFTVYAKPWLNEVHLNSSSIDDVLKHELVHVISGEFGYPIIKVALKMGLVEGLAMAIEWDWGERTLHQYSAQLLKMNMLIDMDKIMTSIGFVSQNSSYSYILSGSFCRFLIDRYGVDNIKNVYASGNFQKVYNKDILSLNSEWKDFLLKIKTESTDSILVRYLFKRPSIFQKVCARVIANANEKASNEFNRKNYDRSAELYRHSLNLSFNNEAQQGLILSYFHSNQYDSVISLTDRIFSKDSFRDAFIPLRLYRGDAFWLKSAKEHRKEYLDSALNNYRIVSEVNLNENYNFASNCRLAILQNSNLYSKMIDYYIYKKDEFLKALIIQGLIVNYPNFNIGKIILARTLFGKGEYLESNKCLSEISDAQLNDFFRYEKYRFQGMNNFYLRNYSLSKQYFIESKKYQRNESTINSLEEWIDKCVFFEKENI